MSRPSSQAEHAPSVSGAVVVPSGAQIDRSVLETEGHVDRSSLPPLQAEDVAVSVEPWTSARLRFRIKEFAVLGIFCFVSIAVYCYAFKEPIPVSMRFSSVRNESWLLIATIIRLVLPPLFSGCVGYVVTVGVAENVLKDAKVKTSTRVILWLFKKLVVTAFCLPFAGLVLRDSYETVHSAISIFDIAINPYVILPGRSYSVGGWQNRTSVIHTILRRALWPSISLPLNCSISENQSGNAYTSAAYEFMTNGGQSSVFPDGVDPDEFFYVPPAPTPTTGPNVLMKRSFNVSEAMLFESLFARAVYLYVDAVLVQDADLGGTNAVALHQLKKHVISYHDQYSITNTTTTNATKHIQSFVRDYFVNASAWSSVLHANVSNITVEYTRFKLDSNIDFWAVTLDIPLESTIWHRQLSEVNGSLVEQNTTWPGVGDVVYEIDVANECGSETCGIQNRGAAPEPRVVAFGVCSDGGRVCNASVAKNSIWLAGFGRRIEGESFQLLNSTSSPANPKLRVAQVRNVREYHRITMGFLLLQLEDLDKRFNAACEAWPDCKGVSFDVSGGWGQAYLMVGESYMPLNEFESPFDLSSNLARGRPLVTRYTTGARIEYEILRPANFDSYNWSKLRGESCAGKMERSIIRTELNFLYIEHPLQVTYTAGLFFLFHNAPMVFSQIREHNHSMSTYLQLAGNHKGVEYVVPPSLLKFGFGLGGGMTLIMVVGVWMRRKKVDAMSSKRLQDPNIFVRVLADSAVFPTWFFSVDFVKAPASEPVSLHNVRIKAIEFEPLPATHEKVIIGQPKHQQSVVPQK